MLGNTETTVNLTQNKLVDYYRNKGYECNLHDKIAVKIEDLLENSSAVVLRICDYCGDKKEMPYYVYNAHKKTSIINKDACSKCLKYKREEACEQLYGTKHPCQLEEVKSKIRKTCLEKYGFEHPRKNPYINDKINTTMTLKYGAAGSTHSDEVKAKIRNTMLERYGYDHPSKVPEIKERRKNTFLERYGIDNPFKAPDFKERSIKTCREKYGVDWAMQSPEVQARVRKSMYENGNVPTSKGQRQLRGIIGGILNYPIGPYNADILWFNGIVVEYDGSGHDMRVTRHLLTEEEFNLKENIRESFFINENRLKIIRIINKHDKDIFNIEFLDPIFEKCVNLLENGRDIVSYDVDTNTYKY